MSRKVARPDSADAQAPTRWSPWRRTRSEFELGRLSPYHSAVVTREEWERAEATQLASCATRSAETRGRRYAEQEHPFRTAFQRDRDRIVHCSSFRRLEYKTQVFVNHEGDHYRTRLTHTLETAQISRTIARTLRLNEDLTEALALAHDLGHTPFGHAGEDVMGELMREHGGFDHNRQGLRILEVLERRYPDFPGLNLTWEVREGIIKHTPGHEREAPLEYDPERSPSLESQIIDFADEIAYTAHDIDDGLAGGMLDLAGLERLRLWVESSRRISSIDDTVDDQVIKYQVIRGIIDFLVTDLIQETSQRLKRLARTRQDVLNHAGRLVGFTPGTLDIKNEMKAHLFEQLYRHYRVVRMGNKARRIITELFETYVADPEQLPPNILARMAEDPPHRVVCDYIAGMTDRYALDEHKRLFDPHERV